MIQKTLALVVGIVLSLVGVLGFLLPSPLLGLFPVNMLHNLVHLATGVLGIIAGIYAAGKLASNYNKYLGIIYVLVAILGFVVPALMLDLLMIDMVDNMLHLVLGAVLAGVGFGMKD